MLAKHKRAKAGKSSVRFAVVGLGHFAQAAILPAFANASDKAQLAALVTGDQEKARKLSRKYQAPAHNYEAFDALMSSGQIDAVYIALPNSMHRDFAVRAAQHGVHVLCEKPLAYTASDAQAMVDACQDAGTTLMTAYRLHFEAGNLKAIAAVRAGKIGQPRLFVSTHTMQVAPDNIRIDRSLGGGPLEDIGIYCLNAARYVFGVEPLEVSAVAIRGSDPRFVEVPEAVAATLRFPDERLAVFLCGFGEVKQSEYRVIGTEGMLTMDPGFTWQGDIQQTLTNKKGKNRTITFKHRDQVAAEILYFSCCVMDGKQPEPSGAEGLIDVRIIEALREAYARQKVIRLEPLADKHRPNMSQSIRRRPPRKPKPIKAKPPVKR